MARMHSGSKGKSGSHKPLKLAPPSWLRYKPKEVELLIIKLAREGKSASLIGLILRDTYGIPNVRSVLHKSVSDILKQKNLLPKLPDDLVSLIKKNIALRKHLEANHKDTGAIRGLQLTESKIKRLVIYFKKIDKLPEDWKYEPNRLKLLIE